MLPKINLQTANFSFKSPWKWIKTAFFHLQRSLPIYLILGLIFDLEYLLESLLFLNSSPVLLVLLPLLGSFINFSLSVAFVELAIRASQRKTDLKEIGQILLTVFRNQQLVNLLGVVILSSLVFGTLSVILTNQNPIFKLALYLIYLIFQGGLWLAPPICLLSDTKALTAWWLSIQLCLQAPFTILLLLLLASLLSLLAILPFFLGLLVWIPIWLSLPYYIFKDGFKIES